MASGLSCSEKQKREEAATPGQPGRARARCLESPRQFTLENHRLPLALPQSFASPGTLTFRCKHSPPDRCASQHKKHPELCRNCGGRIFPVEDGGKPRTNSFL